MRRSPVGSASWCVAVLLAALAACSGSGTSVSPSVGPRPAPNQSAQGGRGGRGSVIDTTRFVRTSPPSDPVIRDMWQEGMNRSQTMALSQVLFDSIGPRLTNSDRYNAGQGWLAETDGALGGSASNERRGKMGSWEGGAAPRRANPARGSFALGVLLC